VPTDQLQCQQAQADKEAALLRRKLAALLAAAGPQQQQQLAQLDEELSSVLADVAQAHDGSLQQAVALGTNAAARGSSKHEAEAGEAVSQPALLAAALEDAEATVALLQARLVASTRSAGEAQARVAELQQRLMAAAVRRTREVAAARAAGEVQLASLQEAVQRLGQRSDTASQVVALSLELADLKRGEAQLSGEVGLLQQELADTAQQLVDTR
jgi:chromosome segregation ATPase